MAASASNRSIQPIEYFSVARLRPLRSTYPNYNCTLLKSRNGGGGKEKGKGKCLQGKVMHGRKHVCLCRSCLVLGVGENTNIHFTFAL